MLKLTREEYTQLTDHLVAQKDGNMQLCKNYVRKKVRQLKYFNIMKMKNRRRILGHISGPYGAEIQYEIRATADGAEIHFDSYNTTLSEALEIMADERKRIMKRLYTDKPKFHPKRKPGSWWLQRNPGMPRPRRLSEAVALAIVSEEFADHCIEWGFEMRHKELA